MKKLLATTAVSLIALTGAASAQSVLERVLGQIDNATNLASVNGTFANIAENIGGSTTTTVYSSTGEDSTEILSEIEYNAMIADIESARTADLAAAGDAPVRADFADDGTGQGAFDAAVLAYNNAIGAANSSADAELSALEAGYTAEIIEVAGLGGVNGSISNIVDGIDSATQEAVAGIDVSAIEWNMPTLDFGDMATTALGAVNTGDITLGVNSSVDEAKTTSTQAVSSVMSQLGGSADTGAIVLNIASNMTGINGSISNAMSEVNGTIGNLSTTALGAVNTGTIVSGVDSAVQGIIGMSGSTGANVASN